MKKFNNNYRTTVKNTLLEMMYMSGTLCEAPDDGVEGDLQMPDGTTRRVTIPNSQGSSFNNETEKLKNADTEEAKKQKEEIQKKEDNPNYSYENKNERIKQVEDMAKTMTDSSSFKVNASAPTSAPASTRQDFLTKEEAENGNPRENRIKTQKRLEALSPKERRDRVVAANAKRKELSGRAEASIMAGLPDQAARDARTAERAKIGAFRVDGAGNRIDPSTYAATDKAKRATNPIPANSSNSYQRKEYDASRSPGYEGHQAGINRRSTELMASVNDKIKNDNLHTDALAAQGRLDKIQADTRARMPALTARRVAGERKLASMEADPNLKGSLAQRGAIQAANIANRARRY